VAIGLPTLQDFQDHVRERDPGALRDPSTVEDLALAFSGAIVAAYLSEAPASRAIPDVDPSWPLDRLTLRQLQVAALLAHGLRQRAIAARLQVSQRQVRRHIASAIERLGVANTEELVAVVSSAEAFSAVVLSVLEDGRTRGGYEG
jgi:DNA-binding NarL/FixJ family response regulator